MSLQGTLKDFGIADIFQLIGHQSKTGVLELQDKDREIDVRISFVDGAVAQAQQSTRNRTELLGAVMVRAHVLTQEQLDRALATQSRTLQRLGDVLIDLKMTDRATIKDFARLQTTETIYRLFSWRSGTYRFVVQDVDYDTSSYEPIRAENVLMEGFRMVDEWPSIRAVIPSVRCTFLVVSEPPTSGPAVEDDDLLAGLDDALSGQAPTGPRLRTITDADRAVFRLVAPGLTVQQIADVARLGEFDASRALATLAGHGHLRVLAPDDEEEEAPRLTRARAVAAIRPLSMRLAVACVAALMVFGLVRAATHAPLSPLRAQTRVQQQAVTDMLVAQRQQRLRAALDVYEAEHGSCPPNLVALADAKLVPNSDIEDPMDGAWQYNAKPCNLARGWHSAP
jgi:hypothetical protein